MSFACLLKALLITQGVAPADLVLEERSASTYENALAVAKTLKDPGCPNGFAGNRRQSSAPSRVPSPPAAQLESKGGYFGWVLRLVQQRHTRVAEFRQLLRNVVAHLEGMETEDRERWLDLLSFLGAMIYHERSESEHVELHETVEDSVCGEELRREVSKMSRTMADVLIERGWTSGRTEGLTEGRTEGRIEAAIETRQQTLIRQLGRRFGKIPAKVTRAINATTTADQLDEWLDRFATAGSLDEMGF